MLVASQYPSLSSLLPCFFPSLPYPMCFLSSSPGRPDRSASLEALVRWKEEGLPCQKQDNRPGVESHVLTPHHQTEPSYLTKSFSLSGSGLLTQCIWTDLVSTREAVCRWTPVPHPQRRVILSQPTCILVTAFPASCLQKSFILLLGAPFCLLNGCS